MPASLKSIVFLLKSVFSEYKSLIAPVLRKIS